MVEDPAPAWLEGWRTRRDERCLEELVALYRPMVLTLCRRILRDHAEAEDAAQDTFIALSEHAADIATHPGAWLRAVACRQALMRRRALVRARRHLAAEPAEPATAAADPLLALVDECVDQLEDGERELIYRHYVLDETQRELARHHGVSQVAIHKRLERSIERLRLLMRRRGARIAGSCAAWR